MKPAKLGNVWTAKAAIRYIDEKTMKWKTVAECVDTPNAIAQTLNRAKKIYSHVTLCVHSDVNGKYIP